MMMTIKLCLCAILGYGFFAVPRSYAEEGLVAFRFPPLPPAVPSPETKLVGPLPKPPEPITYDFELCDGGGFKILLKGDTYPVESSFSYPQGGVNVLLTSSEKDPECEPSWRIVTRKAGPKQYRVLARGRHYAVEREIRLHPHHLTIKDTISNLTDEDIGIIISNHLDTQGRNLTTCYLGGVKGRGERPSLHNPTTFVGKKGLGLGLVAIDDVYVAQGSVYGDKTQAGISDKMFGLGPKASYTMTWSIYPIGSEDYFDFINVVRNDLGLNGKTIEGGLWYTAMGHHDSQAHGRPDLVVTARSHPPCARTIGLLAPKYVCVPCLSYAVDDPGVSIEGIEFMDFPKEIELLKKTFAETKKKFPELMVMFHIAHSLYATNKPQRYADSRVIDRDGKQVVYSTNRPYMEKYFSKEKLDAGWDWYIFYPTLENSFGKAMLKAVDVMMDEIGVTGVWADGLMALFAANFTYDRWDGHTVEIDPKTKTVTRKLASLHLLCQDVIMAYCEKISSKGGVVICDSGPGTLTFARNAAVAAYPVESGSDEECRKTHLAPFPMALGYPRSKPEPGVYRDVQAKLDWGVLYYYYYGNLGRSTILSRMYPITIEKIHSGFVRGKERLVTAHCGAYGWARDRDLHFAFLSDGRGLLVTHNFLTTVDRSGVRTEITLRQNEMAVLRKIPVTIRCNRPINLTTRQYDHKAIQLALNGNGKINVAVKDGDFPIQPEAEYVVKTRKIEKVGADRQAVLSFSVPLDGQLEIRIEPVK